MIPPWMIEDLERRRRDRVRRKRPQLRIELPARPEPKSPPPAPAPTATIVIQLGGAPVRREDRAHALDVSTNQREARADAL